MLPSDVNVTTTNYIVVSESNMEYGIIRNNDEV